MARVTIIDIPDHQVDAVLRAVQALSGGAPTPPPMVVEFPRVLPAPEPPAEPASAEPDPPAAPVRHPNRAKRQAVAAKGPRAKKL